LANALCNSYEDKVAVLLKNPKYSKEDLCILLNKLLSYPFMHVRKETFWLIGIVTSSNIFFCKKNRKMED